LTIRNYGGGGGRRYNSSTISLGFPPFTFAVKWLIIANTAVYLLMLILAAIAPAVSATLFAYPRPLLGTTPWFALMPWAVTHGLVWQLVTYSFVHGGLFHVLFNMLTLWMFGSQLEMGWKHRRFLEFYFYCVIAAALTTISIAYMGTLGAFGFLGIGSSTITVGASGGIYGLMVAFAMLYGEQEFMLFPLPISIKAKYLVAILVLVSLAGAFQGMGPGARGESVAYFAHLGGALFGWVYIRFLPRRGILLASSEGSFGIRNRYQKWKRRRMAKKFEVYMSKHDRRLDFDEDGNYRPPEEDKKNGETRPPWVN
jgi:membrane associated rhomboid family serine protease